MTAIIGIDPGKSGGIAFISKSFQRAVKMPETERDLWQQLMDARDVGESDEGDVVAYLEKVGPMPKQGVTSVWTFGQGYGATRMALIGLGIRFETVTPQRWQKAMGCMSGGDKNVTKRKAQELFPSLKITHAIADSLLIAEHGRRTES